MLSDSQNLLIRGLWPHLSFPLRRSGMNDQAPRLHWAKLDPGNSQFDVKFMAPPPFRMRNRFSNCHDLHRPST